MHFGEVDRLRVGLLSGTRRLARTRRELWDRYCAKHVTPREPPACRANLHRRCSCLGTQPQPAVRSQEVVRTAHHVHRSSEPSRVAHASTRAPVQVGARSAQDEVQALDERGVHVLRVLRLLEQRVRVVLAAEYHLGLRAHDAVPPVDVFDLHVGAARPDRAADLPLIELERVGANQRCTDARPAGLAHRHGELSRGATVAAPDHRRDPVARTHLDRAEDPRAGCLGGRPRCEFVEL